MEHVIPEEFDSKILSSDKKTLVLFYADWCPYCAKFKPTFEEIDSKNIQKKAALVNEDENPLWDKFKIQSIPTMIAFCKGEVITRRDAKRGVGLTRSDMESILRELISEN
ncbi:MAG: thioredoxin family protein [Nitrosopumilaceae archaeon]